MNRTKKGSALPLVLVFSFLLLTIALAYSKLTQTSKLQSVQIDERIKLDYAVDSLTELALLKYQLFPNDFDMCVKYANGGGNTQLYRDFIGDNTLKLTGDTSCKSSFNENPVQAEVTTMLLLSSNEAFRQYALLIEARSSTNGAANSQDIYGRTIDKTSTKIFDLTRVTDTSLIGN